MFKIGDNLYIGTQGHINIPRQNMIERIIRIIFNKPVSICGPSKIIDMNFDARPFKAYPLTPDTMRKWNMEKILKNTLNAIRDERQKSLIEKGRKYQEEFNLLQGQIGIYDPLTNMVVDYVTKNPATTIGS